MTDVALVQHGDMICLRRDMYNVRDISCEAIKSLPLRGRGTIEDGG